MASRSSAPATSRDAMPHQDVVLIVDDQPANIRVLTQALAGMGLRVLSASNGEDALGILARESIDLILLDAMMPGMSGFEVAQRVRENRSDELLPIVMVTALDSQEDLERAFAAGVNDFLRKPVNIPEVRARVTSFLRMRRQERDLTQALRTARSLGEFQQDLASLLVHDFKGPLATIRVLTNLIRDELPIRPDAVPGDLGAIEQTCDRLTQMVLGLIDISKMEQAALTLECQQVDLGELARDALRAFAAQAAAREITFEAQGQAPLQGDPGLLSRVVANLVENAIAHTPDRGAVMIFASADETGRRTLRVTNTGSSLPYGERAHVFEKYGRARTHHQTQPAGRTQRGLGLYFCRLAVEAHGGTIEVQGPENGPITFELTFSANAKTGHQTDTGAARTASGESAAVTPNPTPSSRAGRSRP
jgi:signal transduction histidine kinase